jgi:hypothetical protein
MNKGLGATRNAIIELVDSLEETGAYTKASIKKDFGDSDFMIERSQIEENEDEYQYPGQES